MKRQQGIALVHAGAVAQASECLSAVAGGAYANYKKKKEECAVGAVRAVGGEQIEA